MFEMHDASTPTLTMVTWHQGPEGFRATSCHAAKRGSFAPATNLPKPLEWNICCVPTAATVHGEWLRSIIYRFFLTILQESPTAVMSVYPPFIPSAQMSA